MKVLVVGSGGREHAIAWKLAQSPRISRLYIAPGNAGTAQLGENIPIMADDVATLVAFAEHESLDLVVIGPEVALAAGLANALHAAGIRVFGPSQASAQIETSKAFSKAFMARHNIPTARFACFSSRLEAGHFLDQVDFPVVIKTSGLAAGKGVILPNTTDEAQAALDAMMVDRVFGAAADEVIIEERLSGEEVSLLAFCDGYNVCPLPPAQDHKRLLEGDRGPNTGGMGAYAPAPVLTAELLNQAVATILQPTVDGLRAEGMPFVGILYAGLILTPTGLQVLEFNCRFGDPETQALLPLLETDLLDLLDACVDGHLAQTIPTWKPASAACVVMAAPGYPGKVISGQPISGLDASPVENAILFHAGTRTKDNQVLTAGGRVLNITGIGATLKEAVEHAYGALHAFRFEGMQYRRDIAHHALHKAPPPPFAQPISKGKHSSSAYAASGVDIDAGNRAVELMRSAVRATYTPAVLAGIGAFGGLFDATNLQHMNNPVLVASTDGVGTKVRLGAEVNRVTSLGEDIVNHCINDILVQGARPLFFLDYFATSRLDPQIVAQVVTGISNACRVAGCVLLGGETAEMPGVYTPGEFDIAGTIVGCVERDRILPRTDLHAGDLLVGLRSNSPHTNGYSLIRRIIKGLPLDEVLPEIDATLADALLAPHRSYLSLLTPALNLSPSPVKALAHLTGGGFIENIPRILPEGLSAVVKTSSWPVPPLYHFLQDRGQVSPAEMYRVFNMGIGMVAILSPQDLPTFQQSIPEETWVIGELTFGKKAVVLQ